MPEPRTPPPTIRKVRKSCIRIPREISDLQFRTKIVQSRASEKLAKRERKSGLWLGSAVQRFSVEPRSYWGFSVPFREPRSFDRKQLAEREGFEPPVRSPVLRISSAARSTTLPPLRFTGVPVDRGRLIADHWPPANPLLWPFSARLTWGAPVARTRPFTNRQDMALFAVITGLRRAATAGRACPPVPVKRTKTTKTA